jgi:hypothetical protein
MAARVKETAKQEAEHIAHLVEDGAKSGAYIYPIRVRMPSFETG